MAQEEEQNLKQSFPRELLDQPPSARLSYFKAYTVAHPFLERADEKVRNTLREPGGALLIFIIGPTGVGKTTLLTFIEQRLLKLAQAQLSHDPDYVPVIKLDAMASSARQFRWPDFYTRALMAVSEPLIDYKVERGAVLPVFNERMGRHVPPRLVGDAAALQRSWEQVLKYRRPEAILIDEAQHFAKTAGGTRLEDQLDHVKSLAIATKTMYVIYNLEQRGRLVNNWHYVYSELVSDVLFQKSRARLYIMFVLAGPTHCSSFAWSVVRRPVVAPMCIFHGIGWTPLRTVLPFKGHSLHFSNRPVEPFPVARQK